MEISNNIEDLKRIILKAINNGWDKNKWQEITGINLDEDLEFLIRPYHIYVLIFSPDFLRMYFLKHCRHCKPNWENHQFRIMRAIQRNEDPIKYLKRYL